MLDLGGYLREQRQAAKLSVRQLSQLAGISNPYLSQIERGLKKPSAEILQQIARGLQVSAESLYIQAGILDEAAVPTSHHTVLSAIAADPGLTDRQRQVLVDVYRSFVDGPAPTARTTAAPTVQIMPTARTPHNTHDTLAASAAGPASRSAAQTPDVSPES
ncbi:MAG: helix-turn-helix transcriptional regulator [Actinomycetales bacterium]|nr:helix-turn-helix transcriptional regulator [Actinomycetales bacterium]